MFRVKKRFLTRTCCVHSTDFMLVLIFIWRAPVSEVSNNVSLSVKSFVSKHYDESTKEHLTPAVSMPSVLSMLNYSGIASSELGDIFISVKTSGKFHRNRIDVLLKTWFKLVSSQTFIFTDVDDPMLNHRTNGHLVNTNCSSWHLSRDLCCKQSVEFDVFMESRKKWFCHVDDDTYVNIPALVRLLQHYQHNEDWYLGKISLAEPVKILLETDSSKYHSYQFATGGAGYCISRGLFLKMVPYVIDGKLVSHCSSLRLPDDCTVGFIISYYLRVTLTVVNSLHSHLERLQLIHLSEMSSQVTFSYSLNPPNTINISGFNSTKDPTRFLSLHCHLFPMDIEVCPSSSGHVTSNNQ